MRILLVEDTPDLAEAIIERLHADGHAVDWLTDGDQASKLLSYQQYSLIILDLGLPKLDGMGVLKQLRQRKDKTPVLILTARSGIEEKSESSGVLTGYDGLPEPNPKAMAEDYKSGKPHFFTAPYKGEDFRFIVLERLLVESGKMSIVKYLGGVQNVFAVTLKKPIAE